MKLPSSYDPNQYEADIYALWEREGTFLPKNRGSKDKFSLVLPPPNANGNLHIGHALTVAIEDALVRYHRLQGKAALFVPGADHAGFETWVVYEKKLQRAGKSRFDFNREELYAQVWDFVQENRYNFEAQLRALGASLDWSRFSYTLDNKVVDTAYQTFKKMWDEELIYRGQRIVNYCTFHGTSFSDIEVVHKEEAGKLWHIDYPLSDGSGHITVATTRPETMLGDTAVAVNPKDERYKKYVGKAVRLPLVDREIPVVADEMVDMKFGSGAVKITPAHDPNDFEVARRHKLPAISVIGTDGQITHAAPKPYQNLGVMTARQKVVDDLKNSGILSKEEDYIHSVGHCYKCDTVIEPLLSEQWFVSMRPLADKAIKAIKQDKIKFYPMSKKSQVLRYLTEVRDWNISRQIAWGIPIPAFQNQDDMTDWIFDERVKEETIEVDGKTYRRDPDVFDTWFSSGSWPYVTLDYPEGEDFKRFYPLNLMETGGEILHQWVARMIMLGLYVTDEVPFTNVYIHGYVLAEDGAKMSKSLDNVINPMDAIGEYGSDALRMGLLTGRRPGINQGYHAAKVLAGRNFANKLWNVARFVESKVEDDHYLKTNPTPLSEADHWVIERLNRVTSEVANAMENYRLSEAWDLVYQFVWHDFADWYIEASKSALNAGVMAHSLESILKLVHPFAPFVTETIWQTLKWEEGTILATAAWPTEVEFDAQKAKDFEAVIQIVSEARQIVTALGVGKPNLYYQNTPAIAAQTEIIARLAHLGEVSERAGEIKGMRLTQPDINAWLDIDQKTAQKYLDKLKQRKLDREASIKNLQNRLDNESYVANAPAELVEQTRTQLEAEEQTIETIDQELATFQSSLS